MAEHETFYAAYYFVLDKTGVSEIDEILKVLAEAGKAYHSTERWDDRWDDDDDEPTYIDRIQAAANKAADAIRGLREGEG